MHDLTTQEIQLLGICGLERSCWPLQWGCAYRFLGEPISVVGRLDVGVSYRVFQNPFNSITSLYGSIEFWTFI